MKVDSVLGTRNNSFGSIPIFKATLPQKPLFGKRKPLDVFVSVLGKADLDREAMQPQKWQFTSYGVHAIEEMYRSTIFGNKQFLAIEAPSLPENKQIKAIAVFLEGDNKIVLDTLQSKSQTELLNRTKGAGSLIIYALSKIAKIKQALSIDLYSARRAKKFYKKLGFECIQGNEYTLPIPKYKELQRELEKKYHIIPVDIQK